MEFAFVFPFALALAFIVIWFAYMMNAKSALNAAVPAAVRAAYTRGDPFKVGEPPLDFEGDALPDTIGGQPAFRDGVQTSDAEYLDQSTDKLVWDSDEGWCTVDPADVPLTHRYAVLYAYRYIKQAVGNTVRYPCDTSSNKGDGCVHCFLQTLQDFDCPDPSSSDQAHALPDNQFRLICDYRPYNLLMKPITSLLGAASANPRMGVLRRMVTGGATPDD